MNSYFNKYELSFLSIDYSFLIDCVKYDNKYMADFFYKQLKIKSSYKHNPKILENKLVELKDELTTLWLKEYLIKRRIRIKLITQGLTNYFLKNPFIEPVKIEVCRDNCKNQRFPFCFCLDSKGKWIS